MSDDGYDRLVSMVAGLEAMRLAGLRPTVYVCAPVAVKPWACGWSWTDSEGRHQSRHELGDGPIEAVENAVAVAELARTRETPESTEATDDAVQALR